QNTEFRRGELKVGPFLNYFGNLLHLTFRDLHNKLCTVAAIQVREYLALEMISEPPIKIEV
ncbi:hypothetical protein KKA00_12120, partial [bacterium]|nr:hypothetical protein [bacterium]